MLQSLKFAFHNREFLYWLGCVAVMNIGLQLFLGGISVFFSNIGDGLNMTLIMASAFVPVPFTLMLYNKILKKKGLKFAFKYILLVYSVGMSLMMLCHVVPTAVQMPIAILCAIIVSFSIGAFFSITYTVPAQLAAEENKRAGAAVASTMFFAVQGLAEAISAALATQVLLVFIRTHGELVKLFTLIVSFFCMMAFVMASFLPKSICSIGKELKKEDL
jgi:MFS family permease